MYAYISYHQLYFGIMYESKHRRMRRCSVLFTLICLCTRQPYWKNHWIPSWNSFRKVWFQFQPHVQVRGAAKAACRLRVVVTVVSWQGSSFMVQDCFWEHVWICIYIYIEYAENIYIYNILRSIYSTLCTYVFNIIHIITLPRSYQQDFGAYP